MTKRSSSPLHTITRSTCRCTHISRHPSEDIQTSLYIGKWQYFIEKFLFLAERSFSCFFRQLAAVLAGKASSIAEADAPSLDSTAAHCNWAKKNAKLAGESSRELYLRALISVSTIDLEMTCAISTYNLVVV